MGATCACPRGGGVLHPHQQPPEILMDPDDNNHDHTPPSPHDKSLEAASAALSGTTALQPSTAVAAGAKVVVFRNGAVYTGSWQDGVRHGWGVQVWPDGARYEGNWRNDRAHGHGRFIHVDGDVFDGEWVQDKATGWGIYRHADGSRYEGQWFKDRQHGVGQEVWPDDARYSGAYVHGMKHGFGHFLWSDGSTYEGMFESNDIHGVGRYTWSDGRRYEGTWRRNTMSGHGQFSWADGRIYRGAYECDRKHGPGVFSWPDGRKYIGGWLQGQQDGVGVYSSARNAQRVGQWQAGRRKRWIKEAAEVSTALDDAHKIEQEIGNAMIENNENFERQRDLSLKSVKAAAEVGRIYQESVIPPPSTIIDINKVTSDSLPEPIGDHQRRIYSPPQPLQQQDGSTGSANQLKPPTTADISSPRLPLSHSQKAQHLSPPVDVVTIPDREA